MMQKKVEIENFICPICHRLLLDPVVASDMKFYNRNCLEQHIENTKSEGKHLKSPITNNPMDSQYIKVIDTKNHIIELIQKTDILDEYIKDISIDEIIEFGIHQILQECGKLPKINMDKLSDVAFLNIIQSGDEKTVLATMDYFGDKINYHNILKKNNTFLIKACEQDMSRVAISLLDKKNMQYNIVNNEGTCALIVAYENGMEDVILKLLDKDNIDQSIRVFESYYEESFLIKACEGRMSIVAISLLDKKNIQYNIVNKEEMCALIVAYENGMEDVILKLLDKDNIDQSIRVFESYYGESFLIKMCDKKKKMPKIIDKLLINRSDDNNLNIAYDNGFDDVVLRLLEKDNIVPSLKKFEITHKKSFLMHACGRKRSDIVMKLLDLNIDIDYNQVDEKSVSALISACENRLDNIALKLLEKKEINYNQINKDESRTALIYACKNGMVNVVEKLLGFHDINYRHIDDYSMKSALEYCSFINMECATKIIEKYIADNMQNVRFGSDNRTLLERMIYNQRYDIAYLLVKNPSTSLKNDENDESILDLMLVTDGHYKKCFKEIINRMIAESHKK
jgi:ankyrin repeat protein